jgi:hypothetical protein
LPYSWTIASPRSTDLGTSKEVRGFVENVNRISATEVLEHERINKDGVVIEHQVLDYGRVQFEHKKRKLWPPQEAIYLDVNGKSIHHGHTYSDYRVFSVD